MNYGIIVDYIVYSEYYSNKIWFIFFLKNVYIRKIIIKIKIKMSDSETSAVGFDLIRNQKILILPITMKINLNNVYFNILE